MPKRLRNCGQTSNGKIISKRFLLIRTTANASTRPFRWRGSKLQNLPLRNNESFHTSHAGLSPGVLCLTDAFPGECLAIRIDRRLRSTAVIDVLSDRFILRDVLGHIRSDNGPEFVTQAVRGRTAAVGARTVYIDPRSSWANGYFESFNARHRDELLNGEIFLPHRAYPAVGFRHA